MRFRFILSCIGLVTLALSGCATVTPRFVSDWPVLLNKVEGEYRIVIQSYGSPPQLIGQRMLKGSGLAVTVYHATSREPCFGCGGGEADGDFTIDFRDLRTGIVRQTDTTYDPRASDNWSPIATTTYTANSRGKSRSESIILLPPEAWNEARAKALVAIANTPDVDLNDFFNAVSHIRNMGVEQPELALSAMSGISVLPGGLMGHLEGCKLELEWFRDIRAERSRTQE